MSLSEKISSAKNEILLIQTEAKKRASLEELTKRKIEETKIAKKNKEIANQALADRNWQGLKPLLLNSLNTINKNLLDGKGSVSKWENVRTEKHSHKYEVSSRDEVYETYQHYVETHFFDAEVASLGINNIGAIRIFRLFTEYKYKVRSSEDHPIGKVIAKEDCRSKVFYINIGENIDYLDKLNSLSLLFNPSETGKNLLNIEEKIVEKIVKLHKETLLDNH
jgi:hypothetical protein